MSGESALGAARMQLAQAVTRSTAANGIHADDHLDAAAARLREADRPDLALRLAAISAPSTSSEARYQMREVMQLVDAEIVNELDADALAETFATEEVRS